MWTNLVKLVTTTWAILKQYLGNAILFVENIFCMFKHLSAGKYIRITMYERVEIYRAYKSQTNAITEWGRRNSCTKVEGGGCKREYFLLHNTI